jgi:DNA-binding SARP family transcriptional activator/ABC-type branched-subunit amino acid transport system substrate-binding protein
VAAAPALRLLGPLEVGRRGGGSALELGGVRRRSVLAILLLRPGEVVSVDRLVEGLWGNEPPETAVTVLHGHISRLRRILADAACDVTIATRAHGYVLEVDPACIDAVRGEGLLEQGRAGLAEGRLDESAGALDAALALWRGPPLADLADEPFARDERARLHELHVSTLEERAEVDLARGREQAVIGLLRPLVRDEPLRERPRAQLMLALHRAGRDAEAVALYDETRRALSDELGLAPGPRLRDLHERILRHDPELQAAPRTPAPPAPGAPPRPAPAASGLAAPRGRRPLARRRALAAGALAGAALVGAVVLAFVLSSGGGDGAPSSTAPAPVAGDVVVALDPASARVTDRVRAGGSPSSLTAAAGLVWALNADDQTLTVFAPGTGDQRTVGTGSTPLDLTLGADALWVVSGARRKDAQFVGPVPSSVDQLDLRTGAVRRSTALPPPVGPVLNGGAGRIVATQRAVWAVDADGSVIHIDPGSGEVVGVVRSVRALAVVATTTTAWAFTVDDTLVPISAATNRAGVPVDLPIAELGSMTVGRGALWITDSAAGVLWHVIPGVELRRQAIPVGVGAGAVVYGEGAVWVSNALAGTVVRVDPARDRVQARIPVNGTPRDLAIADGRLWVSVSSSGGVSGSLLSGPLPGAACGPTLYGGPGRPDAVIVTDLPLRAAPRAPTLQMAQAVALTLRRHGFRAGRLRVGVRSCDNSTAQSSIFDVRRCTANAHAFAADRRVIAVVGPYNSACARVQLATYARAPGGPLPVVSPTVSAIDLTASSARRGAFVTLATRDDAQGAAAAVLWRDQSRRRVFVLDDGEPGYGAMMADGVRRAARRAGLNVIGAASWQPSARSYRRLARRVRAARPDAIYLGGLIDTNGGEVLRAVRDAVGPQPAIVAPDGFLPVATLAAHAGAAARGTYVTLGGLVVARMSPTARRFARALAAAAPASEIQPASIYAAQATELVLDALARSDGTRHSVAQALQAGSAASGLLGPVRLTGGHPAQMPVTVVRVDTGEGSDALLSVEGAAVTETITPPRRLLR